MSGAPNGTPSLDRLQQRSLLVGVVALLLCAVGAVLDTTRFLESYLTAYVFWWQITVGCLGMALLNHLMNGMWGIATVRLFEAGARTLPLMALLFVPIVLGGEHLYIWMQELPESADPVLRHALEHKVPYLNFNGWVIRAVAYFALWSAFAFLATRWSLRREQSGYGHLTSRLRRISAAGIIVFGFATSFAAFDWVMSLEPLWFSTIYGGIHAVGGAVAALALAVTLLSRLSLESPLSRVTPPQIWNDLGNVTLAGVMLYTYFQLSQFLIIWSGNLPDEAVWYLRRLENGWNGLAPLLAILHFVVPFLLLLSQDFKRNPRRMGQLACGLLVVHYFTVLWTVVPAFSDREPYRLSESFALPPIHWMDLAMPIGLGGLWLFYYVWQLKSRPLTPANAPAWEHLEELIAHEHEEHAHG